jgi:hypothetical protein
LRHVSVTTVGVEKQKVLNIISIYVYSCLSYLACISHPFCTALYSHMWPICLYHKFPCYRTHGTIFGKKLLNVKCVFWLSLQLLSETFFILRRIQRDIRNLQRSSCKLALFFSGFNETWIFVRDFWKNPLMLYFMKISPVGAELFHADRRTDTHTKANNCCLKFCEHTYKCSKKSYNLA